MISAKTKKRYVLTEITGAEITAREEKPNNYGTYAHYCWETGTAPYDNAIARGDLMFENKALTESFKEIYENHSNSKTGRWELYDYWFRRGS